MDNSLLEELRNKAKLRYEEIYNDSSSTDNEKKFIADIVEFLKYENSFKKVAKSTVISILVFLDNKKDELDIVYYDDLYYKILDEVNKTYLLVDEEQMMR